MFENFSKWVFVHQHTVIDLYRHDGNEVYRKVFAYPSNNRVFYGQELNHRKRVLEYIILTYCFYFFLHADLKKCKLITRT